MADRENGDIPEGDEAGVGNNQQEFIANFVAAMQQMVRNQPAAMASATSTLHILQTIRKYDGSYSAAIWLEDFNQELETYELDSRWAIRNIDRVFEGTAATWWKSQRAVYLQKLNAVYGDNDEVYEALCEAMRTFFSEDSIRERARIENQNVKFSYNEDPVVYVARKVDVLTRMNPTMTQREQVMQLLLGLPENIRILVSPGDVDTVDKFASKLSQQLALHHRGVKQSSSDSRGQSSQASYRKVGMSGKGKNGKKKSSNANKPIQGLEIPDFTDEHKAQCVDEQGNRTCWHCRKRGHTVRSCFTLAREQGLSVPSSSKSQSSKGQGN